MQTNRLLILILSAIVFFSCNNQENSSNAHTAQFDSSYKVEDGFELQLVATDPLIVAPVAIDFDNQGRIWVVEMRGYMPTLTGDGEDQPVGRISILDNFDKNGVAQRSTVFLDSLVLPRAIAHVYGGLLYAEPPNLWFVEINGDKPGKKTLVDSLYAQGGYVELQPNGLMMNVDNWIYNANSISRYQMRDGKWYREPTSFRGQWGITKDNYGRLYYNYNELQLAGDYVLPNTLVNNQFFIPKGSENKELTPNQRVYPLHPTTVNRGYQEGILTSDSLLMRFTAACGPLLYRGNQFPDSYQQNVFVCEPQANLIKRNILSFDSLATTAKQAWDNKEFVASTNESFRPVNLVNAPDGSMYVIDMHRGVLEHRAVASPYYRDEIAKKKLDTLLSGGRIIRIKNKSKSLDPFPDFAAAKSSDLINMLSSSNGWLRDRAQQLLLQRQDKSTVPALEQMARDRSKPIPAIHALHTLNGLNALNFQFLKEIAADADAWVTAHSLLLLQQFATKENVDAYVELLNTLSSRAQRGTGGENSLINLYIAATLSPWMKASPDVFLPYLKKISSGYAGNIIVQEAVVSSAAGHEQNLKNKTYPLDSLLTLTVKNKRNNVINPIFAERKLPKENRAAGMALFRKTCAACHGNEGEGIEHVAPPLRESQFVQGSVDRLAMIILNGLQGPIHINNKEYRFNGAMPAFAGNFSDEEIADIIRYVRNSFVTSSRSAIDAKRVKQLRSKVTGTLTEEKLQALKD